MASMMDGPKKDEARPIVVEQKEEPAYCMTIEEDEEKNGEGEWYLNILRYLKDRAYPKFTNMKLASWGYKPLNMKLASWGYEQH